MAELAVSASSLSVEFLEEKQAEQALVFPFWDWASKAHKAVASYYFV